MAAADSQHVIAAGRIMARRMTHEQNMFGPILGPPGYKAPGASDRNAKALSTDRAKKTRSNMSSDRMAKAQAVKRAAR